MTKTNKILIGILLISSLLLGIGYSAIENITLNIGGTATAIVTEFSAETLNTNCYGGYVTNYKASNATSEELGIGGWRIFHSDGENIYLIADDYINTAYVPAGKGGNTVINQGNNAYQFGIEEASILKCYEGISDIDTTIKNKWLKQYIDSGYNSKFRGICTAAYLLDIKQWSAFKDSTGYAEYAVGAPTLELFLESYNRTHPDKTIEARVQNEYGYQIKWNIDTNYSYEVTGLDTMENLYILTDTTKARAALVASMSPGVMYGQTNEGNLIYNLYYKNELQQESLTTITRGSRPIVCLNSNVKLKLQDENTYFIME